MTMRNAYVFLAFISVSNALKFKMPISSQELQRCEVGKSTISIAKLLGTQIFMSSLLYISPVQSAEGNTVVDKVAGYSLLIPSAFTIVKRNEPAVTLAQFQQEEILLAASSFVDVPGSFLKGASVSVTRTGARRLLKDFGIEWWFGPLAKLQDLGSAALIAELLILQRQGW